MKNLSLIHMTTAMGMMTKLDEGYTSLQMVATYLAPAAVLVKSQADPSQMDPFIAQAAEIGAEEGAEILADFFRQFNDYLSKLGWAAKNAQVMLAAQPGS